LRQTHRYATAVVAVSLSAACARTPDVAGTPTGSAAADTAISKTPVAPLRGTTWRLSSIDDQKALDGVRVTAIFEDDDRVAGSAGCNGYSGGAVVTGAEIKVGVLASTRMYCGATGVMPQEQAYLSALGKVAVYNIVGSKLQTGPAPGTVTLVFRAE
jgi:heat shock protein HslJ